MNTETILNEIKNLKPAEQYSLMREFQEIMNNNPNFYDKANAC